MLALASVLVPARARAQACCAGSGALTPGRLMLHDEALVGVQTHVGAVHGSFTPDGNYAGNPSGTSELDLEQDVFGAVRVLTRGQVALLVPFVETRRATPRDGARFGGGVGDVNVSARYDLTVAGASSVIPGFAVLAGVTFPTGTPPEKASDTRLATDATGIGALQGTLGVGVEQTWGEWLASATVLASARAPRHVGGVDETLGVQLQWIGGVAYAFGEDRAIALLVSYTSEGDATINGLPQPNSGRSVALVSLGGLMPLGDRLRLQGNFFLNPPLSGLGQNLPAATGINLAMVFSWS